MPNAIFNSHDSYCYHCHHCHSDFKCISYIDSHCYHYQSAFSMFRSISYINSHCYPFPSGANEYLATPLFDRIPIPKSLFGKKLNFLLLILYYLFIYKKIQIWHKVEKKYEVELKVTHCNRPQLVDFFLTFGYFLTFWCFIQNLCFKLWIFVKRLNKYIECLKYLLVGIITVSSLSSPTLSALSLSPLSDICLYVMVNRLSAHCILFQMFSVMYR